MAAGGANSSTASSSSAAISIPASHLAAFRANDADDVGPDGGFSELSTSVASAHSATSKALSQLSLSERNKDLTLSSDGEFVPAPHLVGTSARLGLDQAGVQQDAEDAFDEEEELAEAEAPQAPPMQHRLSMHERFAVSPAEAAAALAGMGAVPPTNAAAAAASSQHQSAMHAELTSELRALYTNLQQCLELRDRYMTTSLQANLEDNPKNWDAEYVERLESTKKQAGGSASSQGRGQTEEMQRNLLKVDGCALAHSPDDDERNTTDGPAEEEIPKPWRIYPAPPRPHWELFNPPPESSFVVRPTSVNPLPPAIPPASPANATAAQALLEATGSKPGVFDMAHISIPGAHKRKGKAIAFKMEDGVFQVYEEGEKSESADSSGTLPPNEEKRLTSVPSLQQYFKDLDFLLSVISDGPAKSFAWRRLKYLEGKWNLYSLLNEYRELDGMKRVPHRDFYNVRKVDTHVHHSASMNQKHLLRFIKAKIKRFPDDVVIFRDGKQLTLQQVFESLSLTAYDLSIDTLDMHAHQDAFHRFDKVSMRESLHVGCAEQY